MKMRYSKASIIGLVVLVIFGAPAASAVKLSVSSDDVSVSSVYNLADPTSLHEETMILDGGIVQNRQASGSDKNELKQYISGSDYKASNVFSTNGAFRSSTSTMAAKGAAIISQDLSSKGDIDLGLLGATSKGIAGQQASVTDGAIQSSQSLTIAGGVLAGQETKMGGEAGSMDSIAESEDSPMVVSAQFDGDGGDLDAQILSIASQGPHMQGTTHVNGLEFLNDEILQCLESGEVGMRVDGLYDASNGKLGSFGVSALRTTGITDQGSHPEIATPLGDSNSYVLLGGKINTNKPIQLYLRNDAYLRGENLDATSVAQSIAAAANTWDYWTKPGQNNLFKPTVAISSSKGADRKDGYSTHAFKPVSANYISYARTWYDSKFQYIIETDVIYNTDRQWTTDWSVSQSTGGQIKDVQTLALHELGHACGLGDLYTLPATDPRRSDDKQIMNGYHGPQHQLGAGDVAGLQTKYGA
jgi:hypothetical protein